MKARKATLFIIIILTLSIFSGCKPAENSDKSTKLTIVTSFYPMYLSTINITKGISGVDVVNMTKPQTGCLHDYQLTPDDLITLEHASVFVVNGAHMENFLDRAIKNQKSLKIVTASANIPLIVDKNGEPNPHVWVSISDNILEVMNISNQLAAIDKPNAAKYKSNAALYIAKLEALKAKMHKAIDPLKNRDIITFHEAFPYFAKEFSLNIVSVIEREPGVAPSPKELASTIDMINKTKVKAIFAELQYPVKTAQTIARETSVKIYNLDPVVTGDTNINNADGYIKAMELNLISLEEALK